MLKIYVARHGQNKDNARGILNGHRDLPLTWLGKMQAHELALGIQKTGLTFQAIYSSPLERALETANIIAETLDLKDPEILADLRERDFGVMTGKPIKDIEMLCAPDIVKTDTIVYFLSPAGAETFPDLLIRAKHVLAYVHKRHWHGSILLVTHGDLGKMLYAAYYDFTWQEVLTLFHFGNSDLLLLAPDSKREESHVISIPQYNV